MLPAPAQGAMAIQCRADDRDLILRLSVLDHAPTRQAVDAERAMLHELGGGCSVPVGGLAQVHGASIDLAAAAFSLQSLPPARARQIGSNAEEVGKRAAAELIAHGARPILEEFQKYIAPVDSNADGENARIPAQGRPIMAGEQ
jgi:hydroxymethylbilane synthase